MSARSGGGPGGKGRPRRGGQGRAEGRAGATGTTGALRPRGNGADRSEGEGPLPVDSSRLRREFPELSEDELAAYVEVTRSLLSTPAEKRAERIRSVIERGRGAIAAGGGSTLEETIAARYVTALDKMQRRPGSGEGH